MPGPGWVPEFRAADDSGCPSAPRHESSNRCVATPAPAWPPTSADPCHRHKSPARDGPAKFNAQRSGHGFTSNQIGSRAKPGFYFLSLIVSCRTAPFIWTTKAPRKESRWKGNGAVRANAASGGMQFHGGFDSGGVAALNYRLMALNPPVSGRGDRTASL